MYYVSVLLYGRMVKSSINYSTTIVQDNSNDHSSTIVNDRILRHET